MKRNTNKPTLGAIQISQLLLSAALAAAAAGCGGVESTPEDALVDVPEIQGAVAAEDFCGLADQIQCAGALGCCDATENAFADVDECMQKSPCEKALGTVLGSPQVASGEIAYDAEKAGDYLRELAKVVSECGHHPESLSRTDFLVGTRGEGEDCSKSEGFANAFACKPGLQCVVTADALNGIEKGTCTAVSEEPLGAQPGDACKTSEDCQSGQCEGGTCVFEASDEYCVAPPKDTAPPNTDPTHMYIDLSGSGSGSSGDVSLYYLNGGKYWKCTITDTLSDGQEKVCAITETGTVTNSTKEYFVMQMSSGDGLRVDTVCACSAADTTTNKCTTAVECAGTFNDYGDKQGWCDDSSWNLGLWANACGKVWLDSDGHGNCTQLQVNSYDSNYTYCTD